MDYNYDWGMWSIDAPLFTDGPLSAIAGVRTGYARYTPSLQLGQLLIGSHFFIDLAANLTANHKCFIYFVYIYMYNNLVEVQTVN